MDYSKCKSVEDIWDGLKMHDDLDPDSLILARYFFFLGAAGAFGLVQNTFRMDEKDGIATFNNLLRELSAFTKQCRDEIEGNKSNGQTLQ